MFYLSLYWCIYLWMHAVYICLGKSREFSAWTLGTLRSLLKNTWFDKLCFLLILMFYKKADTQLYYWIQKECNTWITYIVNNMCNFYFCWMYYWYLHNYLKIVSQFLLAVHYKNLLQNTGTFECLLAVCC